MLRVPHVLHAKSWYDDLDRYPTYNIHWLCLSSCVAWRSLNTRDHLMSSTGYFRVMS